MEATDQPAEQLKKSNPQTITWTASEFIAHEKSASWYLGLAIIATAIAALIYLITRDIISVVVVIVGAIVFGSYGSHQPRQLEYQLDNGGITIGPKHRTYEEFRSFAVLPEGAFSSITFMPLKRFAAPLSIYYAPQDEKRIYDLLSNHLPFEEQSHDAVDRLMRRIRF